MNSNKIIKTGYALSLLSIAAALVYPNATFFVLPAMLLTLLGFALDQ